MSGERGRQRTLFPALRLWRAEVGSGLDGQRLQDPATWRKDTLWAAAWFEIEAMQQFEIGAIDEGAQDLERARAQFMGGAALDSHYRRALLARAIHRLGDAIAHDLTLKERPRGRRR